jgi:predicted O-methyltransferase YrrM
MSVKVRSIKYLVNFSCMNSSTINPSTLNPQRILEHLEIPEWDTASPIRDDEATFLYEFVAKEKITKTLETGFAFAKSCSHIMAASQSSHISIDPFQENYASLGLENVKKLGLAERLDFRPDFSHNVLPSLAKEGRKFEFIFIDGDHKFDGIFVDFYYADLLIDTGGYIMLHDTWMRSTRLVMSFIDKNRDDYEYIATPLKTFALYRKIGTDKRDGMYFQEFYSLGSFWKYHLITWMKTGKQTPLKKLAHSLKNAINPARK